VLVATTVRREVWDITFHLCQTIDYIYLQATTARRSAFLWFHTLLFTLTGRL
jgi:hypothetical protein